MKCRQQPQTDWKIPYGSDLIAANEFDFGALCILLTHRLKQGPRKSIKLSNQYPLYPQVRQQGAIYCTLPCKISYPAERQSLLSPELCADCRHCQHAFNCKTVSNHRTFPPTFSQLSTHFSQLCVPVRYGNSMKSFHTISYVRASTQQVFIALACLKVPSQKAKNSKLFFHCYQFFQLPSTTTNCIEWTVGGGGNIPWPGRDSQLATRNCKLATVNSAA